MDWWGTRRQLSTLNLFYRREAGKAKREGGRGGVRCSNRWYPRCLLAVVDYPYVEARVRVKVLFHMLVLEGIHDPELELN